MTKETARLQERIDALKKEENKLEKLKNPQSGIQIVITLLTNFFACILIGASIGYLFQNLFKTSATLTGCLVIFGGCVGLFSMIRDLITLGKGS